MHPHVRKSLAALVLGLTVVGWGGCAVKTGAPPPEPQTVTVRVIGINDLHGQLEPAGLTLSVPDPRSPSSTQRLAVGGAAALAGLLETLRASSRHHVTVSSGDMIGATPLVSALFRHEPTVDIANLIGVDLAIPGNHEFDAGQTELLRLLSGGCADNAASSPVKSCAMGRHSGAQFVTFAANVETAAGATLFPPSVVREFGGVRVGFIGAVTRATPSIVIPSGIEGLRFTDEAQAINAEARRLTSMGVQAIVAVVHEGGSTGAPGTPMQWNDPSCPNARGEIFEIVRRLGPEIDLILSAHTHQGYRCVIDGRAVMQATALGRGVSVADLVIDRRTGEVDRQLTQHRNLPVLRDDGDAGLREAVIAAEPQPWAALLRQARPSAAVQTRVAEYAALAAPLARQPAGRISGSFERGSRTDSSAGRLIADAQWAATRDAVRGGSQVALMNPGGVRTDLRCSSPSPCEVSFGDLFAMQPFGNSLVVMTLSGSELRQLLEEQHPPRRAGATFLNPSSSLSYSWRPASPYGHRVSDLLLGGRPVADTDEVRLTVNSFLAEGGDGFATLRKGRQRMGGPLDIEALMQYLQERSAQPVLDPRIRLVD